MSQHVPAWKKLGLKLKYAKDAVEDSSVQPAASPLQVTAKGAPGSTGKRSRDEYGETTDGYAKKRKTHSTKPITDSTLPSNGLGISLAEDSEVASNSKTAPSSTLVHRNSNTEFHETKDDASNKENSKRNSNPSQQLCRKKSVTFTPETKEEDGESISAYFKAWSAEQQQPHTPPKPSTEPPAASTSLPGDISPSFLEGTPDQVPKSNAGNTPKPKEPKSKSKNAEKPGAQTKTAYLDYLIQFHNDKANWKFNKSKQNDLLKNVWSIFRIPPSLNEALYSYIAGLQGLAARQRLASGAEDILKDIAEKTTGLPTAEEMDDLEARKAAYGRVVRRRIEQFEAAGSQTNEYDDQQLEDIRQDIEKGKRAEAILRQTLIPILDPNWKPPPPPEPVEQPPMTATFTGKRMTFDDEPLPAAEKPASQTPAKRKRKSRTDVSSDDSSSSSESESESETSDSNSDSESDDESHSDSEDSEEQETPPQPKRKAVFDANLLDQAFPRTAGGSTRRR